MGNQASALGDGEAPNPDLAARQLADFDHAFKIQLHTLSGSPLINVFGNCKNAERPATLTCKANSFEILEERGLSEKVHYSIPYTEVSEVAWDHSTSAVRLALNKQDDVTDVWLIIILQNSVEFEQEIKLRLSGAAAHRKGVRVPTPSYVGMFAGATKPKPFQRKRPNITHLASGKLPPLNAMRATAIELHRGSYLPTIAGSSRRLDLAVQHIHEGENHFELSQVRGPSALLTQYRQKSLLVLNDNMLIFKPSGMESRSIEFPFEVIVEWSVVDNEGIRPNDSGINVTCENGDEIYFGVMHIRDLKHTFEYFWNKFQVRHGRPCLPASTHGRPIVTLYTLSGESPAPPSPVGSTEVFDEHGSPIRPGQVYVKNQSGTLTSVATSAGLGSAQKVVVSENLAVKSHWHAVVKHQGWLLKKGGIGVGSAKLWIKRYFVLYGTSQGHFLVYYADVTECPLYCKDVNHRNVVDLAKATFIRPGSNRAEHGEVPPNSFDIVTTEREWTLCAETAENMQRWLKLITRAVDEDVAILPDEELVFKVKAKADPTGSLISTDYSTAVKVSAFGVSVTSSDTGGKEVERFFWVYTDFYKWSLLNQEGKLALCLNVFVDSSFSRRHELIFRTKEAVRLATAIEYFIEKFMTFMHVRLELENPGDMEPVRQSFGSEGQGLHGMGTAAPAEDWQQDEVVDHGDTRYDEGEHDLLGFDLVDVQPPKSSAPPQTDFLSVDDSDAFSPSPVLTTQAKSAPPASSAANDLLGLDLLSLDSAPTTTAPPPPPAPMSNFQSTYAPAVPVQNPFEEDDPFGLSAPPVATFGSNGGLKELPPLSPQQKAQHHAWLLASISAGGGPLYEDGILQIATKLEVRGSQARLTLFVRNQSVSRVEALAFSLHDPSGLLRSEVGQLPTFIDALGQCQQIIMIECMKPATPGPALTISYVDPLKGTRKITAHDAIALPITVATFNEPLPLSAADFEVRWSQLVSPGLEAVQVCTSSSHTLTPAVVSGALTSMLKFGRVVGMSDSSDYVFYGSAVLRTGAVAANKAGEMEKISVGCMIKLEINPPTNSLRITVRTLHPAATAAIVETSLTILV